MPRATRATLANPVEALFFWCMHCMRTQVKAYKPETDVPLQIVCIMDAKASIMCKQCAGRSQPCELVSSIPVRRAFADVSWPATGILGDAVDLGTLLKWAKRFWEDNLDDDWSDQFEDWPASVRLEVSAASVDLVKAFNGMDQAHRKFFKQTGNKGDKKVRGLSPEVRRCFADVSVGNRKPELHPLPCRSPV